MLYIKLQSRALIFCQQAVQSDSRIMAFIANIYAGIRDIAYLWLQQEEKPIMCNWLQKRCPSATINCPLPFLITRCISACNNNLLHFEGDGLDVYRDDGLAIDDGGSKISGYQVGYA